MRRWPARVCVLAALALPAVVWSAAPETPSGGQPPLDDSLRRELTVAADTLHAALRDSLPGLRVVEVEAGYLAGQGLLVIVDVSSPWFHVPGPQLDLDPVVTSLEQIPDLVHQVLRDLNLGLSPHQAEELVALRGMRDGQRALRAEQRALRARLRELGRERQRADAPEDAAAMDAQIEALTIQLETARERERALERQATTARDTLDAPVSEGGQPPPSDESIDQGVAEIMCGFGGDFESLGGDERVNVLVRERSATRYYVFRMDQVRDCQRGEGVQLLRKALRYQS